MKEKMNFSKLSWIIGSLLVASSFGMFISLPFFIIGLVGFFKNENSKPEDFYFNLIGIIAVSLYFIYYFVTILETASV